LYAPELVIAHQEAIGLTGDQRMAIKVLEATSGLQIIQTQWKLSTGTEKLATMLSGPVVDETAVLQQIDQVLALEREVKRAQLSMLVHVKNQLTPAQQQKLDKLK
jgi:Spy/CpxP family protein refolding chaperone